MGRTALGLLRKQRSVGAHQLLLPPAVENAIGEGKASLCEEIFLLPPKEGKSLCLSITLLRINFVEIKIGLGINSASRIFSGIPEATEGSDAYSQIWLPAQISGVPMTS